MIRSILNALVVTACLFASANLQADVVNGSFESLFANWTAVGPNSAVPSLDGVTPTDGNTMAFLSTGSGALPVGIHDIILSGVLGLPANSISTSLPGTTEGATLFQQFITGNTQTGISFDWNFLTNEAVPDAQFNDVAFASIWDANTNTLVGFASVDTFATFTGGGTAFINHTGWNTVTFGNLSTNTVYNLVFGVFDVEDGAVSSAILIDNIVNVPEPSVALIGLATILGASMIRRRS